MTMTNETVEAIQRYEEAKLLVAQRDEEYRDAVDALEAAKIRRGNAQDMLESRKKSMLERIDECRDARAAHVLRPDEVPTSEEIKERTSRPEVQDAINESPGRHA